MATLKVGRGGFRGAGVSASSLAPAKDRFGARPVVRQLPELRGLGLALTSRPGGQLQVVWSYGRWCASATLVPKVTVRRTKKIQVAGMFGEKNYPVATWGIPQNKCLQGAWPRIQVAASGAM